MKGSVFVSLAVLFLIFAVLYSFTGSWDFLSLNAIHTGRSSTYVRESGCFADQLVITSDHFQNKSEYVFTDFKFVFRHLTNIEPSQIQVFVDGYGIDPHSRFTPRTTDFSNIVNRVCELPKDSSLWEECSVDYRVCVDQMPYGFSFYYHPVFQLDYPPGYSTTVPDLVTTVPSAPSDVVSDDSVIDQIILFFEDLFNYIMNLLGDLFD